MQPSSVSNGTHTATHAHTHIRTFAHRDGHKHRRVCTTVYFNHPKNRLGLIFVYADASSLGVHHAHVHVMPPHAARVHRARFVHVFISPAVTHRETHCPHIESLLRRSDERSCISFSTGISRRKSRRKTKTLTSGGGCGCGGRRRRCRRRRRRRWDQAASQLLVTCRQRVDGR